MVQRYIVTDLGNKSTVTDTINNEIVFTGPYLRAESQAAELNRQASAFYNQKTTVVSSGKVLEDAQLARDNNATTINPPGGLLVLENGRVKPPPDTSTGSNALKNPSAVDEGTNDSLRPYLETQGVPPGASQTSPGVSYRVPGSQTVSEDAFIGGNFTGVPILNSNPSSAAGVPGSALPGVGAAGDDRGATNKTTAELNAIDYGKIIPQANVLDSYGSYTYQASLYLVDRPTYESMINTGNKNLSGSQLLVQTGGASAIGRNNYFSLDYYIDNIELKSFIVGKGTGLAHNVSDVRMTIIEPNGISFINNLDSAVQQFLGGAQNKKKNFTSQLYLLVIRFYGYDDQGNLVRGGVNKPDQTSDPNAFVEKWYPLALSNVKFKIASKAVEYQIEATAVPYYIGASAARGTIPFNIELSGQTLQNLLAGPSTYASGQSAVTAGGNGTATPTPWAAAGGGETAGGAATGTRLNTGKNNTNLTNVATQASIRAIDNAIDSVNTAPPKANAINTVKKTVRSGLMAALNEYQRELVKQGVIQYPDEYDIEFALDSLASAKIINPSGLNIGTTSMSKPGTAADQKLGSKQSMDPNSKVQGATAGMQIVQFLDNLIRNSSFIKDQQLVQIDATTGKQQSTGVNIKTTSWYKIGFQVTPKEYDVKRNDYAYKIKYIISPYKISQLLSPYFKPPEYSGSHKQYRYWFTGQNDSVISYEENLNSLYYIVLSNADLTGITSSAIDWVKFQHQTRSGQPDMGEKGKVNEPAANAADQLYSPSDLGTCDLTIVGDPAWLQQGEVFSSLKPGSTYYYRPFLADGTINFDSQQIIFEIGYNKPADYNYMSGVTENEWGSIDTLLQKDYQTRFPGATQITRTYIATEVLSHFNKGKFTQGIKGSLMIYYPANTAEGQQRIAAGATAAQNAATVSVSAPKYERSSVTNPTPISSIARGTQQILNPPTQLNNPTLSQLQSSPAYITARSNGATPAAALEAARVAYANGTNNYQGAALPGIRTGNQYIVRDQ